MAYFITNIDWTVNKSGEMFLEKVSDLILVAIYTFFFQTLYPKKKSRIKEKP